MLTDAQIARRLANAARHPVTIVMGTAGCFLRTRAAGSEAISVDQAEAAVIVLAARSTGRTLPASRSHRIAVLSDTLLTLTGDNADARQAQDPQKENRKAGDRPSAV